MPFFKSQIEVLCTRLLHIRIGVITIRRCHHCTCWATTVGKYSRLDAGVSPVCTVTIVIEETRVHTQHHCAATHRIHGIRARTAGSTSHVTARRVAARRVAGRLITLSEPIVTVTLARTLILVSGILASACLITASRVASGRFGELHHEFRSTSTVSIK